MHGRLSVLHESTHNTIDMINTDKSNMCDDFCRGAKVVVAGSAYGEMAMHFIEKYGMMALRLPSKFDMRRFCR